MKLTVPAYFDSGIWFPEARVSDKRADIVWSEVARDNAINAAAATTDDNPFAKFPDWVSACVAGWEGTFLDAGCGYGRVSIPLLKANPGLRCVGVDASPVMLGEFVELAKATGSGDRVDLYAVTWLPFPFLSRISGSFSAARCLCTFRRAKRETIIGEFRRGTRERRTIGVGGVVSERASTPEGLDNIRHNRLAGEERTGQGLHKV